MKRKASEKTNGAMFPAHAKKKKKSGKSEPKQQKVI